MGQYRTGTVTLISGSEKVSGEGCAWVTNSIVAGHTFKKEDENAIYQIALVGSEATLSLTAPYSGASVSGEAYQITRDFTSNYDIPEVWVGDKNWPYHLTEGLRIIDTQIAAAASVGVSGEKTIVDQGDIGTLNLVVSDLNKVHLLKNTSAGTVNLPSVDATNVGSWVDLRKRGSGEVTINRADSDLINGEEWCKNETEQTFAMVVLTLEEETSWSIGPVLGDWETAT